MNYQGDKIHNYTRTYSACTYSLSRIDEDKAKMIGISNNVNEGDLILMDHKKSPTGFVLLKVASIEYYRDPEDMWEAIVNFHTLDVPKPILDYMASSLSVQFIDSYC